MQNERNKPDRQPRRAGAVLLLAAAVLISFSPRPAAAVQAVQAGPAADSASVDTASERVDTASANVRAGEPGQDLPEWLLRAWIGGLVFGDAYWAAAHHDPAIEGANGFWFRRLYLTFDYELDDRFDFRVRFQGESPGDFSSDEKIEPSVKDLWIRWHEGDHSAFLGIATTPTWALVESVWGYRPVERTPVDLYGLGSSRELGIGLTGRLGGSDRVGYHVMLGNGAGRGAETNRGKKLLGALSYHAPSGVVLQAYGDFEERPDGDRSTYFGFAAWEGGRGRVGLLAGGQHRERPGLPDLDLQLLSGFGTVDVSDRVSLLLRYDRTLDPIPGAEGIEWLVLSPAAEINLLLGGVDVELAERVHLIPNFEAVFYSDELPGADRPNGDLMLRTTFSARF